MLELKGLTAKAIASEAERVYTVKGKSLSATADKCLRAIGYAELFPTTRNVKIAESALERLTAILQDVDSGEPAKMRVHLMGEPVLSEERIKNAAVRYYESNVELSRIRENLTRRIAELEAQRNEIEGNIPHAQRDEFNSAIREVAALFGTDNIPDTI